MSKVKGAEEQKWKHAIDPLTLADLTVEEGGTPVFLPNATQTKNITSNVSFHRIDAVSRTVKSGVEDAQV